MRISNFKKEDYIIKLNLQEIRKTIKGSRKGKETEAHKEQTKRMINFLKKIVLPQLKEGKTILNLSNDIQNGQTLEISPRQAKRVKQNLSDLKIVFVPEYGKQKKKGDYPIWLISYDYTILIKKDSPDAPKRKTVEELYTKKFQNIYKEAKKEARAFFEEVEESTRELTNDFNYNLDIDSKEFMIKVNEIIKIELEEIGAVRADFKK